MSEFSLILVLRKENKQNSDITWQFSSLYRSRSFPSAPTLTAKVSIILDTAKLLAMFFYPEGQKKALNAAFAEKKYFHISIPWQQFNALYLYIIPYEKVNNQ